MSQLLDELRAAAVAKLTPVEDTIKTEVESLLQSKITEARVAEDAARSALEAATATYNSYIQAHDELYPPVPEASETPAEEAGETPAQEALEPAQG